MNDKIYILKANTEVFSTSLQEMIKFSNDIFVKIATEVYGNNDYIFAKIQIKFNNLMLSSIAGCDMTSYVDKTHGEITVSKSKLILNES